MSASSRTHRESTRRQRILTPAERRVRTWIMNHNGILSEVAREFDLSVAFVQRIAYNREARSKGLKVEHKLKVLGCPLQQKID